MGIKKFLKKIIILKKTVMFFREQYFKLLTVISPELNTKARYKSIVGKKLNLKNPSTFKEKLLWLKLKNYIRNPLAVQCADKYMVRDYVKDCGYEGILNELLYVYDSPEQIVWEDLPQQFALKWNFGAGYNIICSDKDKLDEQEVKNRLKKWRKIKCWLSHAEMQYKYIDKKIICEKYLASPDGKLPVDYKVYCFNGKAKAILVIADRGCEKSRAVFMSEKWEYIGTSSKYDAITADDIPKPECLEEMVKAAEDLSAPFPFVRADFYEVDKKLIFGELTFTPAAGIYTSEIDINGISMGELLDIGGIK